MNITMNKNRDYIIWLQIVSHISHDQFFEHFENLNSYSNGFSNDDVEEDISDFKHIHGGYNPHQDTLRFL